VFEVRALTVRSTQPELAVGFGAALTVSNVVLTCVNTTYHCRIPVYDSQVVLKDVTVDATSFQHPSTYAFWLASAGASIEMYGGQCRTPSNAGCIVGTEGKFRGTGVRFEGAIKNPTYESGSSIKYVNCFTSDFDPIP
jgi:hypothetical protein